MTVFGPRSVERYKPFFIQSVLHPVGADTEAVELARIAERTAVVSQHLRVPQSVTRGSEISVNLVADRRVRIDEPTQAITWSGCIESIQFAVRLPWLDLRKAYVFTVHLAVGGLPVGHCKFRVLVGVGAPEDMRAKQSVSRYSRVFLSYASEDLDIVADVAQLLEVQGLEYFFDRTSLRAGTEWEQELRREILRSDLFLLCWSINASKSKWVRQEVWWALQAQRDSREHWPDIRPFLIEGPPIPKPPRELRHLYFGSTARLAKHMARERSHP
jgi:hypothetical protein